MNDNFPDNSQIKVVHSFDDLIRTDFSAVTNALCWERNLDIDFSELVSKLNLYDNITEIDVRDLSNLQLSIEGQKARDLILNDITLLTEFGAQPSLNLIKNYDRDEELDFITTDVYSYHVDRSPFETSTFLCTYYGAASEILANDQALQKIQIPEVREKLKELHNGPDYDFEDFLQENFFDLHYQPKAESKPVNLGIGNLWRLAVDYPGANELPCIHRAPIENDGEYRLLLIC